MDNLLSASTNLFLGVHIVYINKYPGVCTLIFLRLKLLSLALIIFLSGCAQVDVQRNGLVHELGKNSFEEIVDDTVLPIKAWYRIGNTKTQVHIYIEGDGHAWNGRGRPSLNPTPENPVALKLALGDLNDNVIYIARPCQFITLPAEKCHYTVWTSERYSDYQVEAIRGVVEGIIDPAQPAVLIGFSGGAYIARSLASGFENIAGIITVAGNINLEAFARYHHIPQPDSSVLSDSFFRFPQFYLTGENDRIISPQLTQDILKNYPANACYEHKTLRATDHSGPWYIPWKEFEAFKYRCRQ